MLKIVYASHTNQKLSHLQDFNPERSTWITSDLYSKSQVQNILLEKSQCLPEDAVIRISELWHKIFYRSFSDIEVASRQFISTLLSEWLKKRELAWARHPGTANLLLDYIGEFLPLLSSSMSTQRMREWLREHPESF